eukprot:6967597-Pyramimonas_sp.AAC.1
MAAAPPPRPRPSNGSRALRAFSRARLSLEPKWLEPKWLRGSEIDGETECEIDCEIDGEIDSEIDSETDR